MTEGGIDTWGVLFLRSRLAASVLVGAAGYIVGQSLATAARAGIGPSLGAIGGSRGAAVGAGVAAGGLALELTAPVAGLAAVGLGMAVIGICACWPLLMSHAGSGSERPGAVVGGVTTAGYLGILVGPVAVGAVSSVGGLRAGLALITAAALLAAVGSWRLSRTRPMPSVESALKRVR